MVHCSHPGCSWQAIAPSENAAWTQYAEHLVEEHAETVDVDVPDGMVQVKLRADGEWITATPEEARELHDAVHGD
jgi:predicted small metal-binding protein